MASPTGPLTPQPGAENTRLADTRWPGHMAIWNPIDATHGGFAFLASGLQRLIYIPLATASLAGALSAALFSKLSALWTVRLNYAAAVDLGNATAIAANTWTDLVGNQSFTVGDATSLVEIDVRGVCVGPNAAGQANIASRLVVDGAPAPGHLGGGAPPGASFQNFLAGNGTVKYTGLTAGSHTVKVQIWTNVAGTYYCRASTLPNAESLTILVVERR